MTIFIIPNLDKSNTLTCIKKLRDLLPSGEHRLIFQEMYRPQLNEYGDLFSDDIEDLLNQAEIVIAVGGDGTIIHAAKLAAEAEKPILGINSGYLGFTAGLEIDDLAKVKKLTQGDFPIEKRMLLDVVVTDEKGFEKLCCHAMNDAVISRGTWAKIIDLCVAENGRPALNYRVDGLIVSTPTGSTAYALSAGGPAISPRISCLEVTPICPHALTSRTIIFSDDSQLSISIGEKPDHSVSGGIENEVYLTVDGEIPCRIEYGDRVIINKSSVYAYFISLNEFSFSEILNAKFHC